MATVKKKSEVADKKAVKKKKTAVKTVKTSSVKTVKTARTQKIAAKEKKAVKKVLASSVKTSTVKKSVKSERKKTLVKSSSKAVQKKKVPAKKERTLRGKTTKETVKVVKRASLDSLFGTSSSNSRNKQETILTPDKIRPEWIKHYNHLIELRTKLRNQMSGHVEDSTQQIASVGMHMADTGADNFDRDFALSLLSVDQDSLFEIEDALKRIQRGVYGICELSGKQIPEARLEAIPWTRYTVEAQSQLEKEGAFVKKRRLGTLNTLDATLDDGARGGEADEEDDSEDKLARDKE